MGAPVFSTFWPRTRPSVESMAMVRTELSPMCCDTSSTKRLTCPCTSRALRMEGRPLSKRTSTTGPITCVWDGGGAGGEELSGRAAEPGLPEPSLQLDQGEPPPSQAISAKVGAYLSPAYSLPLCMCVFESH
eukprot:1149962-Pelagomonas_calceolata.AAC.5